MSTWKDCPWRMVIPIKPSVVIPGSCKPAGRRTSKKLSVRATPLVIRTSAADAVVPNAPASPAAPGKH